jgi:hypothetical protein
MAEQIRSLGRLQCSMQECASVLRVSRAVLQDFLARYPAMREAFDGGRDEGLVSLRRKQWLMADKNPAMAIWLGKQYLGQKDQHATEVTQKRDTSEMSDAEIVERLRELRERRERRERREAVARPDAPTGSSSEPDRFH